VGENSDQNNPHVKRSSSMSFALRWKHEHVRKITFLALFTLTVTAMLFMLLNGTNIKSVALAADGQELVIKTKNHTVQQLLEEQQIQVGSYDLLSMPLDAKLKHGDQIRIERALSVNVTADGETKTLHTVQKTVAAALNEFQITLDSDDKITPSLTEALTESADIQIVRVNKELHDDVVPIAFEVKTKQDEKLLKGKQQTLQEGKPGSKVITKERIYEDGVMVKETVVSETVAAQSIQKIVAVGTMKPVVALSAKPAVTKTADSKLKETKQTVVKNGVPLSYKKILSNVTLTAYSAHVESTGKSPGDSGFGITRTGTKVTEGRTIAVDPGTIPLGWWVYIEGIGYRRAEDTGSAVKGNKIDVYYDSESYAQQFGLKRGYTVYVIGPKKPAAE